VLLNEAKQEQKHEIETLDDIFSHADGFMARSEFEVEEKTESQVFLRGFITESVRNQIAFHSHFL
jgi:hypothetical protein